MKIQKNGLNKKRQQILNILTGKTLYEKPLLNERFFDTDLVLKMKFPLGPQQYMTQRNKHVPLQQFIYNPDRNLAFAYQSAYEKLLRQVPLKKIKTQLSGGSQKSLLRNQVNFSLITNNEQVVDKKYLVQLDNRRQQQVTFPCYVKCQSSIVDEFSLRYNTLIYVLQKDCGFITTSYFVEQPVQGENRTNTFIYILLTQNTQNLLKQADKYKIKKKIDYSQIDLFLNEPVDELGRPYQYNSFVGKQPIQSQVLKRIRQQKLKMIDTGNAIINIQQQRLSNPYEIVLKKDNIQKKYRIPKNTNRHSNKPPTSASNIRQTITSLEQDIPPVPIKKNSKQSQLTPQQKQFIEKNKIKQLFKRVHRNMKDKVYKINEPIIGQFQPSDRQKQKIIKYLTEFFLEFDKIMQYKIQLDYRQKNYIQEINRAKINAKVQSEYILKIKRKRVFELLKNLSQKYGHKTYKKPLSYFPFILPSRHLSFMQRFRNILLYEQQKVNPYGDYSIFSKMDRIKLGYLRMKQHLRVQNLNKIDCEVFSLHDDFQRYGYVVDLMQGRNIDGNVKGGINGKSLKGCWNPLTPWRVDYQTVRNYFGQDTAYQVYLKTHLILYFIVITPLGIIGQVITRLFIYYNTHYTQYMDRGFSSTHKQELIFHLVFFALTIGMFALFYEKWLNKQENFKNNFVQNQTQSTFRYSYRGPYIRNSVTDSVNQHRLTVDTRSILIKTLGFFFILLILGGQCGFFHGMRMAIIKLSKPLPQTNIYLISWAHIICYGIFFIFNNLFYRFVIAKLSEFLTTLQNIPTEDMHRNSAHAKNSLFLIGIELIPVIFILIFQPLAKTSCYSSSCYDEFTQYIYSRYFIVFFFLGVKLLSFLFLYLQNKIKQNQTQSFTYCKQFDQKLLNYIKFIQSQSQKPQYTLSINDETQALLHYGLFLASFPLSPLLGLANMILQYLIQKIELMVRNKRPIPKSQIIEFYSGNYSIIMHLSIFVNSWLIFFTLQEVQYVFGRLIRVFVSQNPTYEGILVLKICIIIISIVIFQIYCLIIRFIFSQSEDKTLNNRKIRKYQKHILQKNVVKKTKPTLQIHKIHPFRTIFRTYHKQLFEDQKRTNFRFQSSEGTQQQTSAQYLKAKKQ